MFFVSQIIEPGWIKSLTARGKDDGSDIEGGFTRFVIKFYGLCQTFGFAFAATDTGIRVYGKGKGNCLRIIDIGGFPVIKSHIKKIHGGYRAVQGAFSAPGTLGQVNIAGVTDKGDFKISGFTLNALYLAARDQLDIDMPADLDQFGRDHSHGTVVGGKGLIQLSHDPADGWRTFHQIDIIAGVRCIEGSLHACDTGTHNHYRPTYIFF
jgi:hypothetical protein